MLHSYENQVETLYVAIQALEVEEKEKLKRCESGVNSAFVYGRWRNFLFSLFLIFTWKIRNS